MAGCLPVPGDPSSAYNHHPPEELISFSPKWYFTREEIDNHSPSRKDGISFKVEAHLRKLYCSYLQELGKEMKVPQTTIATAMMFCHRFYMRQSHAKNHWRAIVVASLLLAGKVEETPRFLRDIICLAYKRDPLALERIRQREVYEKQKETILLGETILLATLNFELSVELPYKPLVAAVKKLDILHGEVVREAWNYVNDLLPTTLCLQHKPHYIAAGSLCLAAMRLKVKLPSRKGNEWWMQLDVSPKILEEVIQNMLRLEERYQKPVLPSTCSISNGTAVSQDTSNIRTHLDSECHQIKQCNDVHDDLRKAEGCQTNDHNGSPNTVVENGDNAGRKRGQSDQNLGEEVAPLVRKRRLHKIGESAPLRDAPAKRRRIEVHMSYRRYGHITTPSYSTRLNRQSSDEREELFGQNCFLRLRDHS